MARPKLVRSTDCAYHVTVRSNNKEWFHIPVSECWKLFQKKLYAANQKYKFEIHTFVLMSNHFHLIASTPQANLDQVMRYFLTEFSRAINVRADRINHVFGN